jgi:hypothetical protein
MERDDEGLFGLKTGNGIDCFDDFDFAQDATVIVNMPIMPTRRFFCLKEPGSIGRGCEIMIKREDGLGDLRRVKALDRSRNLVELDRPMEGWPMMGGSVVRVLGYNRHYINLKQMEAVKKCIRQGGVLLDKNLLNGKEKEEVLETFDC